MLGHRISGSRTAEKIRLPGGRSPINGDIGCCANRRRMLAHGSGFTDTMISCDFSLSWKSTLARIYHLKLPVDARKLRHLTYPWRFFVMHCLLPRVLFVLLLSVSFVPWAQRVEGEEISGPTIGQIVRLPEQIVDYLSYR